MAITTGTRLGSYTVIAALGSGGMGEVYRAHDDRLGRDVALKVLPDGAVADEDRRRRFALEARAVAALNHPNILTVFDVDAEGPQPFIATELVDGETLRDRLSRGPVPLADALRLATQIADGLAHAHDARIVHRDLKPQNVMVKPDGHVKILDFGLGKVMAPRAAIRLLRAGTRVPAALRADRQRRERHWSIPARHRRRPRLRQCAGVAWRGTLAEVRAHARHVADCRGACGLCRRHEHARRHGGCACDDPRVVIG